MGERIEPPADSAAPGRWARAACWLGIYLVGAELALIGLPRVVLPGAIWGTVAVFPIGFFDWLVVGFTPFVVVTHDNTSFYLTQISVGYFTYLAHFACTMWVNTRRTFRLCLLGLVVLAVMTIAGESLVIIETVYGSLNDESSGQVEIHVLNRAAR
jgi:hypothetical protein